MLGQSFGTVIVVPVLGRSLQSRGHCWRECCIPPLRPKPDDIVNAVLCACSLVQQIFGRSRNGAQRVDVEVRSWSHSMDLTEVCVKLR
jgi:hypothetical protein